MTRILLLVAVVVAVLGSETHAATLRPDRLPANTDTPPPPPFSVQTYDDAVVSRA